MKQCRCPNLADSPNLPDLTLAVIVLFTERTKSFEALGPQAHALTMIINTMPYHEMYKKKTYTPLVAKLSTSHRRRLIVPSVVTDGSPGIRVVGCILDFNSTTGIGTAGNSYVYR